MIPLTLTSILVLSNTLGDEFIVDYIYDGEAPDGKEYKYRITSLLKNSDPSGVEEVEDYKQEHVYYLNEIGDNLRCCVECFYAEGYTIVIKDEGDLTDYYLVEDEEE